MAKFIDKMVSEGYCDSRGAATCASIRSLPNWDSKLGIVLLCVKDGILSFYEIDFKSNVGKRVAFVEISKTENFIIIANLLVQELSFDYKGQHFSLTNFSNHKVLKKVFEEELNKA